MIISSTKYAQIKRRIDTLLKENQLPTIELAIELDVCFESLVSLFSQIQVRVLKRDMRKYDNASVRNIVQRVHAKQELLSSIAKEHCFSGYRLASMYLDSVSGGKSSMSVSELRENPRILHNHFDKIRSMPSGSGSGPSTAALSAKTCPSVEHVEVITADILTSCYAGDSCCNWSSDVSKQVMGQEYEEHLMLQLDRLGACYDSEEVLRSKGKAKTPDVLFAIPMGVHLPHYFPEDKTVRNSSISAEMPSVVSVNSPPATTVSEVESGHAAISEDGPEARNISVKLFSDADAEPDLSPTAVNPSATSPSSRGSVSAPSNSAPINGTHYVMINWIDSKALCADEESFQQNLDQVQSYINRYGSGLVIYWQGFVETIPSIIAGRYSHGYLGVSGTSNTSTPGFGSTTSPGGSGSGQGGNSSSSSSGGHGPTAAAGDVMIYVSDHFPQRWIDPTGEESFLH